jgi:hypothetical protein
MYKLFTLATIIISVPLLFRLPILFHHRLNALNMSIPKMTSLTVILMTLKCTKLYTTYIQKVIKLMFEIVYNLNIQIHRLLFLILVKLAPPSRRLLYSLRSLLVFSYWIFLGFVVSSVPCAGPQWPAHGTVPLSGGNPPTVGTDTLSRRLGTRGPIRTPRLVHCSSER